jgi:hypothetical protein
MTDVSVNGPGTFSKSEGKGAHAKSHHMNDAGDTTAQTTAHCALCSAKLANNTWVSGCFSIAQYLLVQLQGAAGVDFAQQSEEVVQLLRNG